MELSIRRLAMNSETIPIYHGKRNFLGQKDLVISFYTQKCQFHCSFCSLISRSSEKPISLESLIKQIDWVFDRYKDDLKNFMQVSIGNEGSILDMARFPLDAMNYFLFRTIEITKLEILSLETRPEFIKESYLSIIKKNATSKIIDVTVGLETQDDFLRNKILNKHIDKKYFEEKVKILGSLGIRLTCYVLLKPDPNMTEEDGIEEAQKTIEYLYQICKRSNTNLIIYLNPLYIAKGSALEKIMIGAGYKPPSIQSVIKIILGMHQLNIPIYTGLSSENMAVDKGDFTKLEDYNMDFGKAIKLYNKTQDISNLKNVSL
jgi:hypothetical protein